MGVRRAGATCFSLFLFLLPAGSRAENERAPSLEFNPSLEVVPQPREKTRSQPKTLFTKTVGGFGISRGSFDDPVDVDHDSEGNYYVLDVGNNRVQKFNKRDRIELAWGAYGSSEGRFNNPSAIAIDAEDFVYVVDTMNHRVQKFDTEGNFVLAWGSLGSSSGKFNGPVDIAFDNQGNIYVLDAGNDRIQKFNGATVFTDEWGRFTGGREGDFSRLTSIAFDDDGLGSLHLLGPGVVEGTCYVQVLNLKAGRKEVERVWKVSYPEEEEEPCHPTRIEIDNEDDYVYILDHVNSALRRFTKGGRYLDSLWEGDRPFKEPRGFTVQSGTREVWVADTGNDVVQRFTLR